MITIGIIVISITISLFAICDARKIGREKAAIKYGGLYLPKINGERQCWRLLICNFVHVDVTHLIGNCIALASLGTILEQIQGPVQYMWLLVVSISCTSLFCYLLQDKNTITVGASGMFYGLLGMIFVYGIADYRQYEVLLLRCILMIIVNIVITIVGPNISKYGHIGGAIGGILYSLAVLRI